MFWLEDREFRFATYGVRDFASPSEIGLATCQKGKVF